jgi:hypothetical protein
MNWLLDDGKHRQTLLNYYVDVRLFRLFKSNLELGEVVFCMSINILVVFNIDLQKVDKVQQRLPILMIKSH